MTNIDKETAIQLDKILIFLKNNRREGDCFKVEEINKEVFNESLENIDLTDLLRILDAEKYIYTHYETRDKKHTYHIIGITPSGKLFIQNLGFVSQFEKDIENHKLESKIKKLTIKDLEGSIWQVKYIWVFILLNFLIALITSNLNWNWILNIFTRK